MSGHQQSAALPPAVTVPMMYMVDTGVAPVFDQTAAAGDPGNVEGVRVAQPMTVCNARLLPNRFTLDIEGFAFAEQATRVTDFRDDDQLASVYTPEVEALIARLTGASKVVVYDHTRRSSDSSRREAHNWRPPVPLPHSDYTARSAEQRLRDALGDAAEARLGRRYAIVNTWRSTTGTVEQWPIAVCDARSVDDEAMHMIVRSAPHRTEPSFEYNRSSETRHASYDPDHRWYWFPRMTRDEVLLFKNFDTLTDGTARYALHSAFDDPSGPPNPAPRESIESRAFAFYD